MASCRIVDEPLSKAMPTSFPTLMCVTTVYHKKYAHGFCFAVLCCGYTLTDFPISIRLTSLTLWQANDCPSASKATPMNMDKYFMWIHYERLHNHNKAKHNKTVCIFLGIYCIYVAVTWAAVWTIRCLSRVRLAYWDPNKVTHIWQTTFSLTKTFCIWLEFQTVCLQGFNCK